MLHRMLPLALCLLACSPEPGEPGPRGPMGERGPSGPPGIGVAGPPGSVGTLTVERADATGDVGSAVAIVATCEDGRTISGGCQWGKSIGQVSAFRSEPVVTCDAAGENCELGGWACEGLGVGPEIPTVIAFAVCDTES